MSITKRECDKYIYIYIYIYIYYYPHQLVQESYIRIPVSDLCERHRVKMVFRRVRSGGSANPDAPVHHASFGSTLDKREALALLCVSTESRPKEGLHGTFSRSSALTPNNFAEHRLRLPGYSSGSAASR